MDRSIIIPVMRRWQAGQGSTIARQQPRFRSHRDSVVEASPIPNMKARRQARAGSIQAVFLLDALHVMPPGSSGVSSDAGSDPFGRQHGILEPEAGRGYIARAGRQKDPMKEGGGVARPASIRCCGRFCAPYGACDRLLCASSRYVPEGCDMDDGRDWHSTVGHRTSSTTRAMAASTCRDLELSGLVGNLYYVDSSGAGRSGWRRRGVEVEVEVESGDSAELKLCEGGDK